MSVKTFEAVYTLLEPYKDSPFFMSIMLAQWALESDYGQSELATRANNYTGHKAKDWKGSVYRKETKEYVGGKWVTVREPFRYYDTPADWAKHHAYWLNRLPDTYAKAIASDSPEAQAKALQGTYATDPKYSKKLMDVIQKHDLKKYDERWKGAQPMSKIAKPKMIDRRRRALGYPGHGIYPRRLKSAIKKIAWHYSATLRSGSAEDVLRGHERFWKNSHGWDIGGYHYFIGRDGTILWNYDLEIATYGAGKANPWTMHICCEASQPNNYTPAQIKAREQLTLWLMTELGLTGQDMLGHKEVPGNSTPCPGYTAQQLQAFRDGLDKKLKESKGGSTYNPQGLETSPIPKYTSPKLPFDTLEEGRQVTIRDPFSWVDLKNRTFMKSKRHDEIAGTKDFIKEIRVLKEPMSYSRVAYLLEQYNSWILEQDLVEARASWDKVKDAEKIVKETEQEKLPDGHFWVEGELFKIVPVQK